MWITTSPGQHTSQIALINNTNKFLTVKITQAQLQTNNLSREEKDSGLPIPEILNTITSEHYQEQGLHEIISWPVHGILFNFIHNWGYGYVHNCETYFLFSAFWLYFLVELISYKQKPLGFHSRTYQSPTGSMSWVFCRQMELFHTSFQQDLLFWNYKGR